ncbi:MAG: hypothetical protein WBK28_03380 [Minisyncoccia bacterium]
MAKFSDPYVSALIFARSGQTGKAIETLCEIAEAAGADGADAKVVLQFLWAAHAIHDKSPLFKRVQKLLPMDNVVEVLKGDGFTVTGQEDVVGRPMAVMTRGGKKFFVPTGHPKPPAA